MQTLSQKKACPLCPGTDIQFLCETPSAEGIRSYWRCDSCDMVFLDPELRLDAVAEKRHYGYHRNDIADEKYCDFLQRLLGPLAKKIERDFRSGASGLDFGSGPQPVLAELMRRQGFRMEIYDPFYAQDHSVLSARYDFVTCCEVVEHFYDAGAGFRQLDLLLKPGGWLGIMTGMLPDWSGFAGWHYHRDMTHVCFYSLKTMGFIADLYDWQMIPAATNVVLFRKN